MEHDFWKVPAINFREQRGTTEKVPLALFFRTEYRIRKFVSHFQSHLNFDISFRPSQHFFGKWNRFVQIVNVVEEEIYLF